jgi:hypothetical protein
MYRWTILAAALLVPAAATPAWAQRVTERVSVGPGGRQANSDSREPSGATTTDGTLGSRQGPCCRP